MLLMRLKMLEDMRKTQMTNKSGEETGDMIKGMFKSGRDEYDEQKE